MERIIRLSIVILIVSIGLKTFANEQVIIKPVSALNNSVQTVTVQTNNSSQVVSPTVPQIIPFEKCTKKYEIPVDRLYFYTLASINANKFVINEIQSRTGYILFTAGGRQFLASLNRVDPKSAILKIVPADNNFYFPIGILTNLYKYIDINISTEIENLG